MDRGLKWTRVLSGQGLTPDTVDRTARGCDRGSDSGSTSQDTQRGGLILDHVLRDWYFIAEQPAPAPHLPHLGGCAALGIVLVTVTRVSRSCERFPDEFDLHLLPPCPD